MRRKSCAPRRRATRPTPPRSIRCWASSKLTAQPSRPSSTALPTPTPPRPRRPRRRSDACTSQASPPATTPARRSTSSRRSKPSASAFMTAQSTSTSSPSPGRSRGSCLWTTTRTRRNGTQRRRTAKRRRAPRQRTRWQPLRHRTTTRLRRLRKWSRPSTPSAGRRLASCTRVRARRSASANRACQSRSRPGSWSRRRRCSGTRGTAKERRGGCGCRRSDWSASSPRRRRRQTRASSARRRLCLPTSSDERRRRRSGRGRTQNGRLESASPSGKRRARSTARL
mmetsp:Transcript_7451/g.24301  ORF Transcript_7451/g.24301 Transcript_7451/m.24301 type:complete len:283 (-) Transcript_7451:427-1275(-)